MHNFINEFKKFAMKGNVIDLAVAVIIGAAFGKITTSLVNDIAMPFIGIVIGGIDLSRLSVKVGQSTLMYGNFIQSIIDFVIIAFIVFVAVKLVNALQRKEEEKKEKKVSEEVALLREIRDLMKEK